MALNSIGVADPRYGFNAETNKKIADITGYTGQFGNGDFAKWLQTDAGKPWADQVSNIAKSPSPVATYTPSTYTASQYAIDENTDTTQGRLRGLLESPNPIMDSARNAALQQANSRGLLNSSIAASAGEKALIDSALPIAQSDAQAHLNTGLTNTAATNAALSFNANAANQADQSAMNAQNAESQFTRNNATQIKQIDANVLMNSLDNDTKNNLARIESDYKTTMQSSASATTIYQTAMQEISKINANKDLNAASKQKSIDNITNNLRDAMAIISKTSNIDVSKLLDFSSSATPANPTTQPVVENSGDGSQESPYTYVPVNPKNGDYMTQGGNNFVYRLGFGGGGKWYPA